jgi:hypothetical protein
VRRASKPKWVKYHRQGKLPLERRSVLVMIERRQSRFSKEAHEKFGQPGDGPDFKDTAATVAVGYIRAHSGGPFFVVPGVEHKDEEITHWADCLGDAFGAPLWLSKQVFGEPRRQWDNHNGHINAVTSEERFGD